MKQTILIEVDENNKSRMFKPDNMSQMDCFLTLLTVVVSYYKKVYGVTSNSEAIKTLGLELLDIAEKEKERVRL